MAGAEVARSLAAAGLATGPPVPTRDGELVLADRGVVLLEHVSGRELTGDSDQEQRWMATTLGAVHVAGLHTDPAPEAFVHDDSTGVTGLIDWAGAQRGPVLYDVASAVMYLGGVDRASVFLDTYLSEGPVGADELWHLDAFRRLRWAVQGAYFARRLVTDDLTGGVDRADNEKGLADARRGLEELDLDVG